MKPPLPASSRILPTRRTPPPGLSDSLPTMNEIQRTRSAHPLFPSDQAFLWLPGFAGDMRPYCTYNVQSHADGPDSQPTDHDGNGARFMPPFPVSPETHILWHTNITPAFPFHPVPVTRTLSPGEMVELAQRVIRLLGESEDRFADARTVLRNDYKFHILAMLSEMGLLQQATSAPMSAGSFRSAS